MSTISAPYKADVRGRSVAKAAEPAIAGTFAACLGLAAGRWGSYIGRSPIYLTDVLFVSACVRFLWARERYGIRASARRAPTGILLAFAAWALIRFVIGGQVNLTALRDATPYAYALAGVLAGAAVVQSTAAMRARTARLLTWALAFHATWFFVVRIMWPGLPDHLPVLSATQGIHVFTVRSDFDTAMVGAYMALMVANALSDGWRFTRVAAIAMCVAAVSTSQTRAGAIATVLAVSAVLIVAARSAQIPHSVRMGLVGLVVLIIGAMAVAMPFTAPGERVLATVGIMSSTPDGARAVGTTRARERAWEAVIDYSSKTPLRMIGGVGFGPNFMVESGAIYKLTATDSTDTRAPHSWWIDLEARLGLVGLVLSLVLTLGVFRRIGGLVSSSGSDAKLLRIASLVVIALIAPLSFGVIMESPFGALPFYWCAGVILGYGALRRAERGLDT